MCCGVVQYVDQCVLMVRKYCYGVDSGMDGARVWWLVECLAMHVYCWIMMYYSVVWVWWYL